ncbi:hypothetical protein J5X84_06265 [Streptosporangiaceae bacterium NEAU-GS5]|nr:hypothetical protein [Streptosporangiaceae bacterium NEAU-GS5]
MRYKSRRRNHGDVSTFITILGTVGALVLLAGYGMVSAGKMPGKGLPYQIINFGGAFALMINSAYHSAWPSAILNVVWCGIGAIAIGRYSVRKADG